MKKFGDLMVSDDIFLRLLSLSDFETFFSFMQRVYPQAYRHIWEDGGDWYVHETFGYTNFAKELVGENSPYFLVFKKEKLIGILKLEFAVSFLNSPEKNAIKLHRIYLDEEVWGQGIGQVLLNWLIEYSKNKGYKMIWLEVMDFHESAIKFYQKVGFEIFESFRLSFEKMHENYRGMHRMTLDLKGK